MSHIEWILIKPFALQCKLRPRCIVSTERIFVHITLMFRALKENVRQLLKRLVFVNFTKNVTQYWDYTTIHTRILM